jgi:hypothetical protein
VRLRGFVQEFGEKYFITDGKILFCKLCEVKVTADCSNTVILLTQKLRKQRIHRGKQTAFAV